MSVRPVAQMVRWRKNKDTGEYYIEGPTDLVRIGEVRVYAKNGSSQVVNVKRISPDYVAETGIAYRDGYITAILSDGEKLASCSHIMEEIKIEISNTEKRLKNLNHTLKRVENMLEKLIEAHLEGTFSTKEESKS